MVSFRPPLESITARFTGIRLLLFSFGFGTDGMNELSRDVTPGFKLGYLIKQNYAKLLYITFALRKRVCLYTCIMNKLLYDELAHRRRDFRAFVHCYTRSYYVNKLVLFLKVNQIRRSDVL